MSRGTLFAIIGAVIIGVIIFAVVDERNEGPLEEAAESIEDAADDVGDEIEDAADDLDDNMSREGAI
ncbi:MAG: hypothetical protein KAH44_19070 [Oricola sp.]|jgi:hypothetical protein|nr:hypothetical protein [Oricola sp.]